MSTPLHIVKSENWIRVNLAIEYCVKNVLISVLHNLDNDATYQGLPQDATLLYQRMLQCKQNDNNFNLFFFSKLTKKM